MLITDECFGEYHGNGAMRILHRCTASERREVLNEYGFTLRQLINFDRDKSAIRSKAAALDEKD
jgi:hypothetical protein